LTNKINNLILILRLILNINKCILFGFLEAIFYMYGNRKGHRHTHRRGIKHRINRTKGIPKEKIILLGNPNVGKSVIFSLLTGKYVTVSNYPGTTVEVMEGKVSFRNKSIIVDTPGINSLLPQSEDERVTRDIILNEKIQNVVQVADTKKP